MSINSFQEAIRSIPEGVVVQSGACMFKTALSQNQSAWPKTNESVKTRINEPSFPTLTMMQSLC